MLLDQSLSNALVPDDLGSWRAPTHPWVLVADACDDRRNRICLELRREGFRVIETSTGAEALAAALRTTFGAVVSDVDLPDMDGFELCRRIKIQSPAVPVVHLSSADTAESSRARGLAVGADGHLTHDCDPHALRSVVRLLVRVSRQESERLAQAATSTLIHDALDALPDHIALLGPTGDVLAVNRSWSAFATSNGYRHGATGLGANYCRVCDRASGADADLARAAADGVRAVLSGATDQFEQDYPCHSPAEERWYRMTVRRVLRPGPVAAVVTHADRTAEHARRESDARFQRFVETTHEGVVAMDTDGRITYANRRIGDMLGYPADELLGRFCFDFMLPEAAFVARTQFARLWRGLSNDVETKLQHADGRSVEVLMAESPILDEHGNVGGVLAMISDMTERKRAQREIAEVRFRSVQEASPDSFILLEVIPDAAGEMDDVRISYTNAAACMLMNRPVGSLAGRMLEDAFPGAKQSGRYEIYRGVYRTGVRRELTFYHDQVKKWLRIIVVKVDRGICIISSDVSELKAAEVVLRRSNDELEAIVAERTRELEAARDAAQAASRAKSDFLSRASHELRTPLNSVIGFSGVLLKNARGELGADTVGHAERINRNGRHLLSLVNELLDLSRIESGKVELQCSTVSLRALAIDVRETLGARALELGLDLRMELPVALRGDESLRLHTDAQRLRQVLLNLVGNAIKYTREGSVVLRVTADDDGIPRRLDVADTGPGIAADRIETLFEPFTIGDTAPENGESTGLGLAIARSLCAAMGYELSVASRIGHGSTFSIHFGSPSADAQ